LAFRPFAFCFGGRLARRSLLRAFHAAALLVPWLVLCAVVLLRC
jgi:hypothetical protein